MRTIFRELLGTLILALIIFLILQATIQSVIVIGPSMQPGLESKQRLLLNKAVYYFHEPEKGDVIVFHPPLTPRSDYIKRIIASPGDTIEVKEGLVYVNGLELHEPYIKATPHYTLPEQGIPEDNYFVLGDNRNNSQDSHNDWMVKREAIKGKVWLSIWPPDKWGDVPDYSSLEQLASATSK
ncbi:signal peptidase I [Chloroflexota bacterium]